MASSDGEEIQTSKVGQLETVLNKAHLPKGDEKGNPKGSYESKGLFSKNTDCHPEDAMIRTCTKASKAGKEDIASSSEHAINLIQVEMEVSAHQEGEDVIDLEATRCSVGQPLTPSNDDLLVAEKDGTLYTDKIEKCSEEATDSFSEDVANVGDRGAHRSSSQQTPLPSNPSPSDINPPTNAVHADIGQSSKADIIATRSFPTSSESQTDTATGEEVGCIGISSNENSCVLSESPQSAHPETDAITHGENQKPGLADVRTSAQADFSNPRQAGTEWRSIVGTDNKNSIDCTWQANEEKFCNAPKSGTNEPVTRAADGEVDLPDKVEVEKSGNRLRPQAQPNQRLPADKNTLGNAETNQEEKATSSNEGRSDTQAEIMRNGIEKVVQKDQDSSGQDEPMTAGEAERETTMDSCASVSYAIQNSIQNENNPGGNNELSEAKQESAEEVGCTVKDSRDSSKRERHSDDNQQAQSGDTADQAEWSADIHHDFVAAIFDIGLENCSPSVIMDNMSELPPFVTRERTKSHLQKYRKTREKSKEEFFEEYGAFMKSASRAESEARDKGDDARSDEVLSTVLGSRCSMELVGGEAAAYVSYSVMNKCEGNASSLPFRGAQTSFPNLTEKEKDSGLGRSLIYVKGLLSYMIDNLLTRRLGRKTKKYLPSTDSNDESLGTKSSLTQTKLKPHEYPNEPENVSQNSYDNSVHHNSSGSEKESSRQGRAAHSTRKSQSDHLRPAGFVSENEAHNQHQHPYYRLQSRYPYQPYSHHPPHANMAHYHTGSAYQPPPGGMPLQSFHPYHHLAPAFQPAAYPSQPGWIPPNEQRHNAEPMNPYYPPIHPQASVIAPPRASAVNTSLPELHASSSALQLDPQTHNDLSHMSPPEPIRSADSLGQPHGKPHGRAMRDEPSSPRASRYCRHHSGHPIERSSRSRHPGSRHESRRAVHPEISHERPSLDQLSLSSSDSRSFSFSPSNKAFDIPSPRRDHHREKRQRSPRTDHYGEKRSRSAHHQALESDSKHSATNRNISMLAFRIGEEPRFPDAVSSVNSGGIFDPLPLGSSSPQNSSTSHGHRDARQRRSDRSFDDVTRHHSSSSTRKSSRDHDANSSDRSSRDRNFEISHRTEDYHGHVYRTSKRRRYSEHRRLSSEQHTSSQSRSSRHVVDQHQAYDERFKMDSKGNRSTSRRDRSGKHWRGTVFEEDRHSDVRTSRNSSRRRDSDRDNHDGSIGHMSASAFPW